VRVHPLLLPTLRIALSAICMRTISRLQHVFLACPFWKITLLRAKRQCGSTARLCERHMNGCWPGEILLAQFAGSFLHVSNAGDLRAQVPTRAAQRTGRRCFLLSMTLLTSRTSEEKDL